MTGSHERPTGAKPREIAGHTWRCYSTGVLRTEWRTDGGRWAVGQYTAGGLWWARVNGEILRDVNRPVRSRRFRKMQTACAAAVKL